MAKVEAVIGKEEGQHRLLVKIGQKAFVVGSPQSVPNTVSRSHCSLSVEYTDDQARKVTKIKIQNLKPQNITYVDGQEVESKSIKEISHVQLGFNRYNMDLKQVVDGMRKFLPAAPPPPPETFSLLKLKAVWEEYDSAKMELQLAEQKKNNFRGLGGILSGAGILFMFIPSLGVIRYLATGLAVLIGIVFFIRGMNTNSSLTVKLHDLDEEFRKRYVCPNPECRHFLGQIPYDVLRQNKGCSYCKCKYKE